MAEHVSAELLSVCERVTVLGREPIDGCDFIADREEYAGPLVSLRGFAPVADSVFVASCDIPLFRSDVVTAFLGLLEDFDAVIPVLDGYDQPLAALYRASAFGLLTKTEGQRVRDWTGQLRAKRLNEDELRASGINPHGLRGVNTPEELDSLLAQASE